MSEKRPGKPDQPQKPNERRYGRPANGDANSGERRSGGGGERRERRGGFRNKKNNR